MALLAITFCVQSAMAISLEQQQNALRELEVARAEINTVKLLIPGFLKNSIGKNLENANQRIAYAQQILATTSVGSRFYCAIESSFDGQFSGRGNTELEASRNAIQACQSGSRSNGFFCKKDAVTCQKEN